MRTLGILLAGGQGKRLGDKSPKALAECAGRTLLDRALETLNALCDHTLVVAPAAMTLPVDAAIRIDDPEDDAGPLGGLVTGLAARAFDEAIVLAVDLPLLTHATLSALRALRGDAPAILPAPDDVPQPLAAWYTPLALPALARSLAAGERAATVAALACAPIVVGNEALAALPGGLEVWLNVNTPADLAEASRRLAARESS